MMLINMPRLGKLILSRLPIFIAIIFSLFALVLFSYTLHTWHQIKGNANTYLIKDNSRRATAVSDQLAMIRIENQLHAELPEILAYLLNRDLGMSMRYGLNLSLQSIDEAFQKHVKQDKSGLSKRIFYLDSDGTVLADTMPEEPIPFLPDTDTEKSTQIIDAIHGEIITILPIVYKGSDGGTVVTVSSVKLLNQNLINTGDTQSREVLLTENGRELASDNEEKLPLLLTNALVNIPEGQVSTWDEKINKDAGKVGLANMLLVKTPVSGNNLYLVSLISPERAYGHIPSSVSLSLIRADKVQLLGNVGV